MPKAATVGRKKRKQLKRQPKKSTAVPRNKQPEHKTNKSSSQRTDKNSNTQSQQTASPKSSSTNDQDSPVIDLTKETGKNSEMPIKKTSNPSAAIRRTAMPKPRGGGTQRPIFRQQSPIS